MSTYTVEQLCEEGPAYAMAMLIKCIRNGEPFITYGAIGEELERQLKINKIFPTQIGSVAGTLMNKILEIEPKAPLINVLITRPNGIPGVGVRDYLADRYNDESLRKWEKVSKDKKYKIVEREREKIFKYEKWGEINKKLFGASAVGKIKEIPKTESDYSSRGGEAESNEHKRLKDWVAKNPKKIGLSSQFNKGEIEHRLLSGDEVDVHFSYGKSFRMVEVKSCRSSDDDIRRGIYQCVKYREVKKAEHLPFTVDVQSVLVTERDLNPELKERAKILGVKWRSVNVNNK